MQTTLLIYTHAAYNTALLRVNPASHKLHLCANVYLGTNVHFICICVIFSVQTFTAFHQYPTKIIGFDMLKDQWFDRLKVKNLRQIFVL